MAFMDFGHLHDASVSERHWCVAIFLKKLAQCVDVLLDPECNLERTTVKEFEQGVLCLRIRPEEIYGLGEHRFTNEKWCFESFDMLDNPAMVSFRSVEKSNEWPGINDGRHRGRSL